MQGNNEKKVCDNYGKDSSKSEKSESESWTFIVSFQCFLALIGAHDLLVMESYLHVWAIFIFLFQLVKGN